MKIIVGMADMQVSKEPEAILISFALVLYRSHAA